MQAALAPTSLICKCFSNIDVREDGKTEVWHVHCSAAAVCGDSRHSLTTTHNSTYNKEFNEPAGQHGVKTHDKMWSLRSVPEACNRRPNERIVCSSDRQRVCREFYHKLYLNSITFTVLNLLYVILKMLNICPDFYSTCTRQARIRITTPHF
jgi:hypothetical protein